MSSIFVDDELRSRISLNLKEFKRKELCCNGQRKAAVAITIVNSGDSCNLKGIEGQLPDSAAVILTRRAIGLKNHAGQWAFPGGALDGSEEPEEAALRELDEEVGLSLPYSKIIGKIDDFQTRSGFNITPVIIWGGAGYDIGSQ